MVLSVNTQEGQEINSKLAELSEGQKTLAEGQQDILDRVGTLAEGQKELARNQGKILDNIKELTKSHALTLSAISKQGDRMDQRFDALESRLDKPARGPRWPWNR